ncbi:hypothetical protein LOD99_4445 [Oopsacas minuta]|uniref:Uncharacterized protein n=1 Tax=Oopsacas minuta TaxID=111878 RepID=A0AAV7JV44_9METZ|nr:hypothetical protein LOD99_4445 [Oopsacas minuta]
MVNFTKGILITCDPAMKQLILFLQETNEFGRSFIIQDLDDEHLFIDNDHRLLAKIQEKIDELMEKNSFSFLPPPVIPASSLFADRSILVMDTDTDIPTLLTQTQSKKRLEREKAISLINSTVENCVITDNNITEIHRFISEKLNTEFLSATWEATHGLLLLIGMLTQLGKINSTIVELYLAKYNTLILSKEIAIRNETAKLLEVLSKVYGFECFSKLQETVLSQAEHYYSISTLSKDPQTVNSSFSPKRKNFNPTDELSDALTWKYLESYLETIRYVAKGCNESVKGPAEFDIFVTSRLIELIKQTSRHPNRFVRESTFNIISLIVQKSSGNTAEVDSLRACMKWRDKLVDCLCVGLSDDWSQVRMSASIACRQFFLNLPNTEWEVFFPMLLPPLCLNRYYEATGVLTYSSETWRIVTAEKGQSLVETHLEAILHFYLSQSVSENHAARTAVLHCIGELGRKLPSDNLEIYQVDICSCLLRTLKDPCWPVREATCYCITAMLPLSPHIYLNQISEMLPALFDMLGDFIPTTRQSAAFTLADLVKVFKDKVLVDVFREIKLRIVQVEEQKLVPVYDDATVPPNFYGIFRSSAIVPGEKEISQPDLINSISQPWMRTDGCVYLIAELSQNQITHKYIFEVLQLLSEAVRHKHYSQHIQLFETICRALPLVAKGIGKKEFKKYFHLFIEMLFYSLNHANLATSRAARESLLELVQVLGIEIVRYRIENFDSLLLPKFDDVCTSIQ